MNNESDGAQSANALMSLIAAIFFGTSVKH